MEELSEREAFLSLVKQYLVHTIKTKFPELSDIADKLLEVINGSSIDFILSHLRAIKHSIKIIQGKSLYLRTLKVDYDELIEKGDNLLSKKAVVLKEFEVPPKASVIPRSDDFAREQKLVREQICLDDNPLFYNLLRSIWLYFINHSFVSKKIFISYAWPIGDVHDEAWTKEFVERFAYHLTLAGFQVYLDDIQGGAGFPLDVFMEKLKEVDHVLLVSSRTMKEKLTKPESGVCQEKAKILQYLETTPSSFRDRVVIPVLLNYTNYCDRMFGSLAEVPMCVEGYLGSLVKLLPRLFGDSKFQFEQWFDQQLKSEQLSVFEGVPRGSVNGMPREKLLFKINAMFAARYRTQNPNSIVILWGESGVGKTELAKQFCHHVKKRYHKIYWVEAISPELLKIVLEIERQPNCLFVLNDVEDFQRAGELLPHGVDILITTTREITGPNQIEVPEFTREEAISFVQAFLGNRSIDKLEHIEALIKYAGCNPRKLHEILIYIKRNKMNIPRYLRLNNQVGFDEAVLEIEVLGVEFTVADTNEGNRNLSPNVKGLLFKPSEQIRSWHIPQRNPNFTGREKLLDDLHVQLSFQPLDNLKPVAIIACDGMGGIGKTQIAIEYVHLYYANYRFIAWIFAGSIEQLYESFREIAQHLNISIVGVVPEQIVEKVKSRLESEPGILLVFDGAKNFDEIRSFVPVRGSAVLITSRTRDGKWPQTLPVPVFSPEDAYRYVKNILGERVSDSDEIIYLLCKTMKYLPLALAQAVAYIWVQKISIQEYLERYEQQERVFLLDSKAMPFLDKHESVYVTFDLALRMIEAECPAARRVLNICAFLDHQSIPGFLIEAENKSIIFEEVLGLLSQYSLITIDQHYRFELHQLVQEVLKAKLIQAERVECLRVSCDLLKKYVPSDEEDVQQEHLAVKRLLLPHLEIALGYVKLWMDNKDLRLNYLSGMLKLLGDGHGDLGNTRRKVFFLESLLDVDSELFDPESICVAETKVNLGNACNTLGEYGRAIELFGQASAVYKSKRRVVDFEITQACLGDTYSRQGNLGQAKFFQERAVAFFERVRERQNLAITLNSLSCTCEGLADWQGQYNYALQALKVFRELSKGKNNLMIAKVLVNVASACGNLGNNAGKRDYLFQALAIKRQLRYPEDHPELAVIFHNLAEVFLQFGDIDEALKNCLLAHKIYMNHADRGPNHEHTTETIQLLETIVLTKKQKEESAQFSPALAMGDLGIHLSPREGQDARAAAHVADAKSFLKQSK